jgi:zinc transport system ATP-binding protein
MTPAFRAEHLSFAYDSEPILTDIDLTIAARDFVCLVGPNGGGKTTLLKLMLGLLKPTAGTLQVFGMAPEKARPRIGYMPQYTQLDPKFPVTVNDVVLMGRLGVAPRFGPFRRVDRERSSQALSEVRLGGFEKRPFSALSGGQRQRVLIARALACEPELLLLDEPTSNLDMAVQDDFYELLTDLSHRLTVVLVSHDVGFVSKLVRTVVCVNRGISVHPTSELSGENIVQLYGSDVRMIQHHHSHGEHHHH